MEPLPQPHKRFVPHKTLKDGWTYVSVPSSNVVIGVKLAVTKIMRLEDPSGKQITDPTGNPVFEFQSTTVARVLTTEEWNVVKKEEELE